MHSMESCPVIESPPLIVPFHLSLSNINREMSLSNLIHRSLNYLVLLPSEAGTGRGHVTAIDRRVSAMVLE